MSDEPISEREAVQNRLVAFLEARLHKFNAPYGVLTGIHNMGRGKMRVITFGVARALDASIKIISPNRISIEGRGALAYKYNGDYKSVEEVEAALLS